MKKIMFLIVLLLFAGCVQQEAEQGVEQEEMETTVMAEELTIKTDKVEYVQADTISITVMNGLDREVHFASCDYLVLEKEVWNKWGPSSEKRCGKNRISHSLAPGESKEFSLETRWSANNYLDSGTYRERFSLYFGCSDSEVSSCESNSTYYSNEFELEKRKLPELEDVLNISVETDREEYRFEETVKVHVSVGSERNIGMATLDVEGIRHGCDRIDSSQRVKIPAGESSFDYEYLIPAADDNLSIDIGLYGINADLIYDGEFEGIVYDGEVVASAMKRIEITEGADS
ncbi:MAG: hypothetical protein L6243_00450 [Candidatus Altiarchaeales archaeon]|nr:hypothetical protein [Candidatus Altiarchaeota archaeon]MBU4406968.1 hypothetical protein [Candidatus Altiarchaeota archaeon]MBU4437520.1 hypothetical protein [Candidatus Altiarchaeota archaeon]MCG2782038.1 hypothetical protein [Candidatus Altiarchaeales archaeon]